MCGIIASTGPSSLFYSYYGLQLLQHRGQDGFGIFAKGNEDLFEKHSGLVNQTKIDTSQTYNMAIAHNRYSTIGRSNEADLQPLKHEGVAICHNGNVTNLKELKEKLDFEFKTKNDAEIFLAYLKDLNFENFKEKIYQLLSEVEGAYSVVGTLGGDYLFCFKDPKGIRPLFMASLGDTVCFASESQALEFLGFKEVEEIEAGEAVLVHKEKGVLIRQKILQDKKRPCMFEWVYFAGVEGQIQKLPIYQARLELGKSLASKITDLENIDIVSPVPDTSRTSAIALAESLNLPYREILIKNRYIQRSFILNSQEERRAALNWKLMPVPSEIKGKNILLVDDSIVRGNTSKKIIELLKEYGAKSVRIASACPPLRHPCYFGVDFPNKEDLVANGKNADEIAQIIGADGVFYLEEEDLEKALGQENLCKACINGDYPYLVKKEILKERVV